MHKNLIEEKKREAEKELSKFEKGNKNKLERTETILNKYKYQCAVKRLKMLEQLDSFFQYAKIEVMTYEELNAIKKKKIADLNSCDYDVFLNEKISQFNTFKKAENSLIRQGHFDKKELDRIKSQKEVISNDIARLQRLYLDNSMELSKWKSFSLENVRTELLAKVKNSYYYNSESNYIKKTTNFNKIISSNSQMLATFIDRLLKYSDLKNKYHSMSKCNDIFYSDSLADLFKKLKGHSIVDDKIVNPIEAADAINEYERDMLKLFDIDKFKRVLKLSKCKKYFQIDIEFLEECNKEYSSNYEWVARNELMQSLLNNKEKQRSSKLPFKKFSIKNHYLEKIIFSEYKKQIDIIVKKYRKQFEQLKLTNLNSSLDAYLISNDKKLTEKLINTFQLSEEEILSLLKQIKKQINELLIFTEGSIENLERKLKEQLKDISLPFSLIESFCSENLNEDSILDKLADITVMTEREQIKNEILLQSKSQSYTVAKSIVENGTFSSSETEEILNGKNKAKSSKYK